MDGTWRDIDEAVDGPRAFRSAAEPSFSGRAVLVVEEDPTLAQALATALRTAGYRAIPSTRMGRALGDFRQAMPDLVVLDLGGGPEALEFLSAVRALGPTPVIALATGQDPALVTAALNAGARACVRKPFGFEALLAPLRAALPG